jgi:hypothetical protein
LPGDDVIILAAELARENRNWLILRLAGPHSDQSHPFTFNVALADEVGDGLIALWISILSGDYRLRFLVRDDKLASIRIP